MYRKSGFRRTIAAISMKRGNTRLTLLLRTNRKSPLTYALSIGTKINDLGRPLWVIVHFVWTFLKTCTINAHLFIEPRNVKSSRPTWPQGQNCRPRPRPRSIRPRPCSRSHAMLASFSQRLSSWPSFQSSKSRHLRYVLLWPEIVACFVIFY